MRIRTPVAALSFVTALATMTIVAGAGCSFDWDLPTAEPGAGSDGASDDAVADVTGATDGGAGTADARRCTSNAACDVPAELCVFSTLACAPGPPTTGPSPTGGTGAGVCVNVGSNPCSAPSPGPIVPGAATPLYCACTNRFFASTCAVAEAGLALDTACTGLDGGYFACGYAFCPRASHFCKVFPQGRYECAPWMSAGCSAGAVHDCPCAARSCTGGTCAIDPATAAATVTCP